MEHLIQRAKDGDEHAISDLYEASRTQVFRLALALLGDPGPAEEVMQDSLYYAISQLDRFDSSRSAWTTWLHTITVSRCRNYTRRHHWMIVPLLHSLLAGGPSPGQLAEIQERTGALHAMLLQLSPKLREAVALRFLDDLSFIEMGQILGCSDKTAQSRVRVGLEKLRTLAETNPALALLTDGG